MRRVRRITATVMLVCLLAVLSFGSTVYAALPSHPLDDIRGSSYEQVVATLWELGIITGDENGKYHLNNPVTRAEMAALIVRAMGQSQEAAKLSTAASAFADVASSHWARGVIALTNRLGIVQGDGTRFYPNDPVNYAQATTMLVRALGYESVVRGGYPTGYVVKGSELGLLTDLKFVLNGGVNRAEAAQMLHNAIFLSPVASTNLTWSQTLFKKATAVSFGAMPTYVAPGQQIALQAVARDTVGKSIQDAPIQYTVVAGIGTISDGVLTAGSSGQITVEATLDGQTATASFLPISTLRVTPETFQASKGGQIQLTAVAMSGAQAVTVKPIWRVIAGPATVDDQGLVTVTNYGPVSVEARLGTLNAAATGQAVGKVTITNPPDYVVPGQPYLFEASAADSSGIAIDVPVTWSATGASIDRTSGRMINPFGNHVTVKATAAGISTEVIVPVMKSVIISPASVTLLSGTQVTFVAQGVDSGGSRHDIQPSWSRSNANVGVLSAEGVFAGTNSGNTTVTASLGSLTGTAQASVSGPPAKIHTNAVATSLPTGTGATTAIAIKLQDQGGALSPVDDQPITIQVSDASRGTVNRSLVLTRNGEAEVTFTAGAVAGQTTLAIAAPGTNIPTQTIGIVTYAQTPTRIQLSATPQPLSTGGGIATVRATLQDTNNFPAPAPQTTYVTLSAAGSTAGGLTGTTITIPAGQSSGTTSFISGSQPGSVQISGTSSYLVQGFTLQTASVGSAAGVKILPLQGATPVTGLSSLQVQVQVVDAAGAVRANDNSTQVDLALQPPVGLQGTGSPNPILLTAVVASGTATFQIPATAVGTATITASLASDPAVKDTATAEFVPGIFSSLRLTAQPTALAADGSSISQVIAEVVDRSGNLVTTVNPNVTFRKLVDGGATVAFTDLTAQAVGGRAILSVRATNTVATDSWYATAPGLDTESLATITTAQSSGPAHKLRVSGATSFTVGSSNTLVVQIVDAEGRVVTSDTGRSIAATHSIAGLTMTSTAVTQNGTATFVLSGSLATSGIINLVTSGLPQPTLQVPVTFGGAVGLAYSLFSSSSLSTVAKNTPISIMVRVMDNQGNNLTTDSGRTITGTVSGPGTLSVSQMTTSGGLAVFTVTGTAAGTATLTFTAPDLPQPQATITIHFTN